MNVPSPDAHALASSLVAFIWQGALIACASALALRFTRPARARYTVAVLGLLLMAIAPAATYSSLSGAADVDSGARALPGDDGARDTLARIEIQTQLPSASGPARLDTDGLRAVGASDIAVEARRDADRAADTRVSLVLTLWLIGVALFTIRLAGGWVVARRLVSRARRSAPPHVRGMAAEMAERLALRRAVTILESSVVAVPTVIGWLSPVVLMPASALSGLSPAQIQAILAHELAHVRRHDYLVNLFQSIVETLLFYHPAVWWLSRRVREEREHCCDDLAVEVCGDRVTYVRALAEIAALERAPHLALAATSGSLVNRVARLLGRPVRSGELPSASLALLIIGALVLAGAGPSGLVAAWPPQAEQQQADAQRATAEAPAAEREPAAPAVPRVPQAAALIVPALQTPPPSPPAPPAAPAVPAAPAAPAPAPPPPDPPPAGHVDADGRGSMSWSDGLMRYQVEWTGPFALSDDGADIARIENGAVVRIAEGRLFVTRVELTGREDGSIERRFFRGGVERPYEPEGREWLRATLSSVVARSGLFAEQRVASLFAAGGADAVLTAIDRLPAEASYARRRYYSALLQRTGADSSNVERIAQRAGKDKLGDHDRATLLTATAQAAAANDDVRVEIAAATQAIQSDYERRRVLMAAMQGAVAEPVAARILAAAADLSSDYERASLLLRLAECGGITPATSEAYLARVSEMTSAYEQRRALTAFARHAPRLPEQVALRALALTAAMPSDFERRQVIGAFLGQGELTPTLARGAMSAAALVRSGYDRSVLLVDLVQRGTLSEETAGTFFHATRTLGSYEHRRVLEAALARKLDAPVLAALLMNAATVSGDHDCASILLRAIQTQTLSRELRDLIVDAAESIDREYDRGRVLAALVMSERRTDRTR